MAKRHHFTEEQTAELLSNPYTARVSACKVTFTLAFKQLVIDNIDKPDMNSRRVFQLAGYSDSLFSSDVRRYIVQRIRKEASSAQGLQEPKQIKNTKHKKKHSETEFKELQERVCILEQQVDFLKKSQLLKKRNHSMPLNNSN